MGTKELLTLIKIFLLKEGIKKVLVITDQNVLNNNGKRIETALGTIEREYFTEVLPEPSIKQIQAAFLKLKGREYEAVLFGSDTISDPSHFPS